MNTNRAINILSAALVLFLAAAAFVLSYDALHELAKANGIKPGLAWLWPLTLDAVMIAASLAVLRASLNAEGKVYQWGLVGAFTLASIGFNIVHAPPTLLARSIFALPPLVVFLGFELLMKQAAATVKRNAAIASISDLESEAATATARVDGLTASIDALASKRDALKAELVTLRREKKAATNVPSTSDATREKAAAILRDVPDISGAALGRELGRSESLGRQLKREFAEVSGNGTEVTQ